MFLCWGERNSDFTRLCDTIFREEIKNNGISLHYTLAHPENYHIVEDTVTLPVFHPSSFVEESHNIQSQITKLSAIPTGKLSSEELYTYTLLKRALNLSLEEYDFPYYSEPLAPHSGMQSQLPILLSEYTFYDKQDVDHYLDILEQVPAYFDGLIVYEKGKSDAGLIMPEKALKKTISQCDCILKEEEIISGQHFLQTTFCQRLNVLLSADIITKHEYEKYVSENSRILKTLVLPAYENLGDQLLLLCDSSVTYHGLGYHENGKRYYEHLIRQCTGSDRTISDCKELLLLQMQKEYSAIQRMVEKNPELVPEYSFTSSLPALFTNANNPEASSFANIIIEELRECMKEDFPDFSVADPKTKQNIQYTVKKISQNLSQYSAPAFYLTPPLDALDSHVIYINEKDFSSDLELFTTLAHEGFPGHLYQSVYSSLALQRVKSHPVRHILCYTGYQEGWALYVEFMAYDYATREKEKAADTYSAFCYKMEKHNRSLQLCLYGLLDMAIHYDNASLEQVAQVLSSFGITNPSSAQAIYEYIVEEPGNYLKYYLGYLEILELKKAALEVWGEDYTDYTFHKWFLETGASDFTSLTALLKSNSIQNPNVQTISMGF